MNIKFEFITVSDAFEQSFKLVLLAGAVAIVNYFIGDESGIIAILSVSVFFISQFIRLLGLVSRYQSALAEIQSALPSLEVGREEIETVEGFADMINDSLDEIEDKQISELEAVKSGLQRENTQQMDLVKDLQLQLAQQDIDLIQSKLELNKAWKGKEKVLEEGRAEVERLKAEIASERERVNNLEMQKGQLMSAMREYSDLDVFLGDDFEAIKKKYQSITNTLNGKKNKNKEIELVS